MKHTFEDAYSSSSSLFYGQEPAFQLKDMLSRQKLTGGIALDIGCGDGRNAIFLANCGYKVIAVDMANTALEKLELVANKHKLNITTICEDVRLFDFSSQHFDVIVAHTVIDHLSKADGNELIAKIKGAIAPNGIIYVSVFTVDDPGITGPESGSDTIHFVKRFFESKELLSLFSEMKLIEYREEKFLSTSHGSPHYHALATILVSN